MKSPEMARLGSLRDLFVENYTAEATGAPL